MFAINRSFIGVLLLSVSLSAQSHFGEISSRLERLWRWELYWGVGIAETDVSNIDGPGHAGLDVIVGENRGCLAVCAGMLGYCVSYRESPSHRLEVITYSIDLKFSGSLDLLWAEYLSTKDRAARCFEAGEFQITRGRVGYPRRFTAKEYVSRPAGSAPELLLRRITDLYKVEAKRTGKSYDIVFPFYSDEDPTIPVLVLEDGKARYCVMLKREDSIAHLETGSSSLSIVEAPFDMFALRDVSLEAQIVGNVRYRARVDPPK